MSVGNGVDYRLQLSIALERIPVRALDKEARQILSDALNKPTVKSSTAGVIRNYRGLAELAGLEHSSVQQVLKSGDPTNTILEFWDSRAGSSVGRLLDHLNTMERHDVLEDLTQLLSKTTRSFMTYVSSLEVATEESTAMKTRAQAFGLDYVGRVDWRAYRCCENTLLSISPVNIVFIHHTVFDNQDPVEAVSIIQAYKVIHYSHDDVPYNWFISQDGRVFEGRGWDAAGSHTFGYNTVSISISFIGNYEHKTAEPAMLNAALRLIEFGIELGYIAVDYGIYPHCDASATLSPGQNVVEAISAWPRFRALGKIPSVDKLRQIARERKPNDCSDEVNSA